MIGQICKLKSFASGAALIFLIILQSHAVLAESSALLTIVSPPAGTVVSPGESINIEVKRAANSGITAVALNFYGWTPILQGADPLVFSVTIPATAKAGPLKVIAFDFTPKETSGLGISSAPLLLTVKGPLVTSLLASDIALLFQFPGDQLWLSVTGVSSSGQRVALQNPSSLSFASKAPNIATVDSSGLVSAISFGKTTVTVNYTNSDASKAALNVPVNVPELIPGELNGDGKIDLEDLGVIEAALNKAAVGPNDARDLNHDGKIDALDARILTTLCTYPRCATHP